MSTHGRTSPYKLIAKRLEGVISPEAINELIENLRFASNAKRISLLLDLNISNNLFVQILIDLNIPRKDILELLNKEIIDLKKRDEMVSILRTLAPHV